MLYDFCKGIESVICGQREHVVLSILLSDINSILQENQLPVESKTKIFQEDQGLQQIDTIVSETKSSDSIVNDTIAKQLSVSSSLAQSDRYETLAATDKYESVSDDFDFADKYYSKTAQNVGSCEECGTERFCAESSVSSTDGFATILAKMKRDLVDPSLRERKKRHVPESKVQSLACNQRDATRQSQLSPIPKGSTRRDFLEILFGSTEALLCGTKQTSRVYIKTSTRAHEKRKGRKKSKKSAVTSTTEEKISRLRTGESCQT
jgi:hypothetical protein